MSFPGNAVLIQQGILAEHASEHVMRGVQVLFLQVPKTVVEGVVSVSFQCFTGTPKLDLLRSSCFLDFTCVFSTVQKSPSKTELYPLKAEDIRLLPQEGK